jgi:Ca2+-binding RTX toxin-like protein/lysophospholipase L1-like esterase
MSLNWPRKWRELKSKCIHAGRQARGRNNHRRPRPTVEMLESRTLLAECSPCAVWDYSMKDRFVLSDTKQDHLPSTFPEVNVQQFEVTFDARTDFSRDIKTYGWTIRKTDNSYRNTTTVTDPLFTVRDMPAGEYNVTLLVTGTNGNTHRSTRPITIKDLLIVSMGDSVAAGQGNPEVPQTFYCIPTLFFGCKNTSKVKDGAKWADQEGAADAKRSTLSGHAQFAAEVERRDPHTSVTFVSVAYSGAGIAEGLLGWYEEKPPQLLQLRNLVCALECRQIDALLIHAGANDIGFSTVVEKLVDADPVFDPVTYYDDVEEALGDAEAGIAKLPGLYEQLARSINDSEIQIATNVQTKKPNIYLVEYFDPTRGPGGETCHEMAADILRNFEADEFEIRLAQIRVIQPLNSTVRTAAERSNWHFVGGVADAFSGHGYCAPAEERWIRTATESRDLQGPHTSALVGVAVDFLLDRIADMILPGSSIGLKAFRAVTGWSGAELIRSIDKTKTRGTLHPNEKGHLAIADRLLDVVSFELSRSIPPVRQVTVTGQQITIRMENGALVVREDGTQTRRYPPGGFSGLKVFGTVGNEIFRVFVDGMSRTNLPKGIEISGGGRTEFRDYDRLELHGSSVIGTDTFTIGEQGVGVGQFDLDGLDIRFNGLQEASDFPGPIQDNLQAHHRVFTFLGTGGQEIELRDDADDQNAGVRRSMIVSPAFGANMGLRFANPLQTLTINGTDHNDTIRVTGVDSELLPTPLINGLGGNDVILATSDQALGIAGGPGDDTITGGAAADTLDGGPGSDVIAGGGGDDQITGGDSADTIDGGPGNDTITGDEGDDQLDGGDGTDRLQEYTDRGAKLTADRLFHFLDCSVTREILSSDELLRIEEAVLVGGAEDNCFDASEFSGRVGLFGDAGRDTLVGGPLDDLLVGADDADSIVAGPGNDTIWSGFGNDTVHGGPGTDLLFEFADTPEFILTNSRLQLRSPEFDPCLNCPDPVNESVERAPRVLEDTDVLDSIEQAILQGASSDNLIDAALFDGPVSLFGAEGTDTLIGGRAGDLLDGAAGNDRLVDGSGNDTLEGGDGDDTYVLHPVQDILTRCSNGEANGDGGGPTELGRSLSARAATKPGTTEVIIDPDGLDTLDLSAAIAPLRVDLRNNQGQTPTIDGCGNALTITGAIENLVGGSANDTLTVAPDHGPHHIDGGPHHSVPPGDTLVVDGLGSLLVVTPTSVYTPRLVLFPITYSNIETVTTINASDDHPDLPEWDIATEVLLNPVTGDAVLNGAIQFPEDTDLFRFVALGDGTAVVHVNTPLSDLDPVVYLYSDGDHELIASNDNAGGGADPDNGPSSRVAAIGDGAGVDSRVSFPVTAGRTYFVLVDNSADRSTGTYQLVIDAPPDPDEYPDAGQWDLAHPIPTDPATGDGEVLGAINPVFDTDLFRYTARATGRAVIRVDTPFSDLDPVLYVYDDPNHELVAWNDNAGGGGDGNGDQSILPVGVGGVTRAAGTLGTTDAQVSLGVTAGRTYFLLVDNAADGSRGNYRVRVNGPSPEIEVFDGSTAIADETGSVTFATTAVGRPVAKTLTIRNIGTADLLLTGGVTMPAGFAVGELSPAPLVPGASSSFDIRLEAAAVGSFAGVLSFSTNDPDAALFNFSAAGRVVATPGPEIVVLDGTADIADNTGTVAFGATSMGTPIVKTFTVHNAGTDSLRLSTIRVSTGFSVAANFTTRTVAPGDSTPFQIRFDAAAARVYRGTLSFGTNDSDENPFNFKITGTATPTPEIELRDGTKIIADNSGSVSFGSTPQGTPLVKTLTLWNRGRAPLQLIEPIVAPAGFTVVSSFGATTLAPGRSTTFRVQLDAAGAGNFQGTLSFGNNDSDENPFDLLVAGVVNSEPSQPLELSINDVRRVEGNSGARPFVFTVSLSRPSSTQVRVTANTASLTALAQEDYTAVARVLTFDPGGPLTQTFTVDVIGDVKVEGNETFQVKLSAASGAAISDDTGVGTIVNDDVARLTVNDVTRTEGNSGTTPFVFTVTLSNPSATAVKVTVNTAGTTATAGEDYTAIINRLLTFSPGAALTQTVTVSVKGDTKVEPDETFRLVLLNPNGATIADDTGVGTIINDDSQQLPRLTINDVAKLEGDSPATAQLFTPFVFTVSLSNPTTVAVQVTVNTADGTTTVADDDYMPVSGLVLTFQPGGPLSQTVTVDVLADNAVESDETFFVNLTGAINATILDGQGIGTILNDEFEFGG